MIIIAIVFGMAMVHINRDLDTSGAGAGPASSPEMEIHQHKPAHTHRDSDPSSAVELKDVSRNTDEVLLLQRKTTSSQYDANEQTQENSKLPNQVLGICKELTVISNLIIMWIVELAPYCIAFLIAGSLAEAGVVKI